jgi:YbgC/YbaW family acyl-CoA thioester hydrolase
MIESSLRVPSSYPRSGGSPPGSLPGVPHETTIKVRFSDLDPYDHVNHARYLSFFEAARVEALEEMGFGMGLMRAQGLQIVLVEIGARFVRPAGLHDLLTIRTVIGEGTRATSLWHQEARLGSGDLVASLDVRAVFTDLVGRPRRAPDGFAAAAARFG